MGPGIAASGEITEAGQIYQNQFAQTIANLLGETFTPNHSTGKPIELKNEMHQTVRPISLPATAVLK